MNAGQTLQLRVHPSATLRIAALSPQAAGAVVSTPVHLPAAAGEGLTCLNCRSTFVGKYCNDCGQSAKTPARISVGGILHELPHAILHLEHALPKTILDLLRRPGLMIREYLAGKRVGKYSPFTLLFLVCGVLGLLRTVLPLKELAGGDLTKLKYMAWYRLAVLPLFAVGPTLVLRRRTGLTYGEQLVASTMVMTGVQILALLYHPIGWLMLKYPGAWTGYISRADDLGRFLYIGWAYAQLQDDGTRNDTIRRWLRSASSMALGIALTLAVIVAGILVYYAGVALLQQLHLR